MHGRRWATRRHTASLLLLFNSPLLCKNPTGDSGQLNRAKEPETQVEFYHWLPPEAAKILLVLFLSFLIGLEREEHKLAAGSYSFGGVRTFPLIGLIGFSLALVSGPQLIPVTMGFMVVGCIPAALLLAQTFQRSNRRCHYRNVGTSHLPGRRARLLRPSLDRHHAQRSQPAASSN